MRALHDISIRAKLSIALGIALALVIVVGLFGVGQLHNVNNATREIRSVWSPKIEALDDMKRAMTEHRILAGNRMQTTSFRQIAAITRRLDQTRDSLGIAEQSLMPMIGSDSEKVLLAKFRQQLESYETIFAELLQRVEIGDTAAAQVDFNSRALVSALAAEDQLDQLISYAKQKLALAATNADEAYRLALLMTIGAILIGAALSGIVIVWTSRHVTTPLILISEAMRRLAVGDHSVSVKVTHERKDEIGVLVEAIAGYRESLIRSDKLAAEVDAERERLQAAVNNMTLGLCMIDKNERLIICNQRFVEIYRLPPELARAGAPLRDIISETKRGSMSGPALEAFVEGVLETLRKRLPNRLFAELADGRTVSIISQPMADGGEVSTHEDITEQLRTQEQIRHMARHDALTDLPNRILFKERMEEALKRLSRGEMVAVLSLDLDRFKSVNDTLGHPVGDELLKLVSSRLRDIIRQNDIIARFGGDEFAVVQVGDVQPQGVIALAQRIIDSLSAPFDIHGHQVVIGVSVGIALAPTDGRAPEQLLKNSDMALYRAKSDGRGIYRFFEPRMDALMQTRRQLELDLRRALIQQEFQLLYQPIIDLNSNTIISFEALLRWHHPERGIISPADFIPLAEEIGIIVPLGEWVLRQACCDAVKWPDKISVSINLSPIQFKNKKVLQAVIGALAASGLSPRRLELEITESVLLVGSESTLSALHELRDLGVRIAMDDFGTGYSSLSYLRSFPFDKVKIDSSFVQHAEKENSSLAIIRAVTGLSTSLGMTTTAEGVETPDQLERVRREGCNEVQGFLISQPRPATDLGELLAAYHKDSAAA
jgi:diguanylate cyclase (GGDEF)-like protein